MPDTDVEAAVKEFNDDLGMYLELAGNDLIDVLVAAGHPAFQAIAVVARGVEMWAEILAKRAEEALEFDEA